ncbi:MAG TPA: nuclear transport factor 2 family protein [Albitalea sp.]|nr:nuclear transport factor 2 family protein [Albitalea sp.]
MNTPTATIQAAYAAFGRGDVAAILDMVTDDVEWTHHGSIGLPYMGTFNGKAAVARWFGDVAELDGIQVFEPREFFAGPDHVTVLGWERTKALPAGKVFESHWVHLFTLRDGKIARFVGTFDTAAAAAARA